MNNVDNIIVFKKNKTGVYVYQGLKSRENDEEYDTIINNCNNVTITEKVFDSLRDNEETKIVVDSKNEKDYIAISFSESLYEKLIDKCKEKGEEQNAPSIVRKTLYSLGKKMKSVKLTQQENNSICSIKTSNKENTNEDEKVIDMSTIDPQEVIKKIKKKVVAQDKTVETIVNNIYNNQLIFDTNDENMIETSKSCILLDGPTGTGKTLIAKQVAKELNIPIISRPATMFSTAGYKGDNLKELLEDLLETTGGNLELAERGIIVLDEFDKLATKTNSELEMKKAVQQDLLAYLGGGKFPIEYDGKTYEFDTSKITFICMGAFTDLRERKIKAGLDDNGCYQMDADDYIEEGLMRELVGRFSLITSTQSLSKDNLKKILTNSELSPLIQLKELGKKVYNKEITYSDEMIDRIANEAAKKDTGARSLATIVNGLRSQVLSRLMYAEEPVIEIDEEIFENAQNETKRSVAK